MRILVVEDDISLNRLICEKLKKDHYSVDSCHLGNEALPYIDGAEYDLIILDIMLPNMDGLEILSALRKKNNLTPVLLLTAKDSIDDKTKTVTRKNSPVSLSSKEYTLLFYMLLHKGQVLSRDTLNQHIWNYDYDGSSNIIDVYIRYLRKKIDEGHEIKLIHTIRGQGYVIREE